MTSPGHILLKMLEPAVRPGQVGSPSARPTPLPMEQQSFESLLASRMTPQGVLDEPGDVATGDETTRQAGPLGPLAGMGQIENASLRELIARHAQAGEQRQQAGPQPDPFGMIDPDDMDQDPQDPTTV